MKNPIRALKQWLETKTVKWDTSRLTNRDLRDPSTGETEILKIVIPCVRYNPDTGQMANWDGFDGDMEFGGAVDVAGDLQVDGNLNVDGNTTVDDITTENITITAGDALYFGANDYFIYSDATKTLDLYIDGVRLFRFEDIGGGIGALTVNTSLLYGDGDTGIVEESDDVLRIDTAGVERVRINSSGLTATDLITSDDVILPVTGKVSWGDGDTYLMENTDDWLYFYCGGNLVQVLGANTIDYYKVTTCWNAFKYAPIATPTKAANRCFTYGKDVLAKTEFHCLDEDGNETQLSSHDKDGYYYHRSTIPKRDILLEIDIERFFRDKYPEYVRESKINEN